jgi:hypothetical protein
VNHHLPYFRQCLICCLLPAAYFCRLCLLKVCMESSSLPLPSSLVYSMHPALSAAVPCLLFSFFCGAGQSVQGAMLVYPKGGCGSSVCCLCAHLLVCVCQGSLEPASGGMGVLLVPQCNMVWRSFVRAGGLGCRSFSYSWWYFSTKCGSSISARFLIYRAHAVCFLPLVAILDLVVGELLHILFAGCELFD